MDAPCPDRSGSTALHVDVNCPGGGRREGRARHAQQLDMPALLALAAALGWASGFRLYAVVFLVGMMGVAGQGAAAGATGAAAAPPKGWRGQRQGCRRFSADKVPGLDSAWDAIHAFIQVPADKAAGRRRCSVPTTPPWRWPRAAGRSSATPALGHQDDHSKQGQSTFARAVFQLGPVVLGGRPGRRRGLAGYAQYPLAFGIGAGADAGAAFQRCCWWCCSRSCAPCCGAFPHSFPIPPRWPECSKNPDRQSWGDRLLRGRKVNRLPHGA